MENLYYPTGQSPAGRTLVCLCCEDDTTVMESGCSPEMVESAYKSWLDENDYCVEKWQIEEEILEKCDCDSYSLKEMDGGAPAGDMGGGSFATLNTVSGMGPVEAPGAGGTNADFYNGPVGSGDKFDTLTVGTPAARKGSKKKKRDRVVKDFGTFVEAMKKLQLKK